MPQGLITDNLIAILIVSPFKPTHPTSDTPCCHSPQGLFRFLLWLSSKSLHPVNGATPQPFRSAFPSTDWVLHSKWSLDVSPPRFSHVLPGEFGYDFPIQLLVSSQGLFPPQHTENISIVQF